MNFPDLTLYPYFCVDLEATGLHWYMDTIFGLALSLPDGSDFYWDTREHPQCLAWFKAQIEHPKCGIWVNQNTKFDALFVRKQGIIVPDGKLDCTMVRAALIDEHRLHYDLDSLGKDCIGVGKDTSIYQKLADMFGGKPTKDVQMKNLHRAPSNMAGHYAKQDSRTALDLWVWQNDEIERQGLQNTADLERRLTPALIDMEFRGVRIDVPAAELAVIKLTALAVDIQAQLNHMAGFKVNPNPSGDIHKLFEPKKNAQGAWVLIDGTIVASTDGGKASIDATALHEMKHPAASVILKLRKIMKTRDTFLKGHLLGHHVNGVIHANINQTKGDSGNGTLGTVTGRFSYNDPALQQISKRDKEMGEIVRSCFIPDEGQEWACCDLKQAEMRWFVHYAQDAKLLQRYIDDPTTDFYTALSEFTGIPRDPPHAGASNTKQIALSAVFGMTDGNLTASMGLPTIDRISKNGRVWKEPGEEGKEVLAKFNAMVPGIKKFLDRATSIAKDRGYVKSIDGRHLRFPRGTPTYKAGSFILQSANASAIKAIVIAKYNLFKGTNSRLLLSVHDETDSSLDKQDVANGIVVEMKEVMESLGGIKCRVPHLCEPELAENWWISCSR